MWRHFTLSILKRSLNFRLFLAFHSVIYQNLLHRRGLYCSKQLETTFHQFCQKPLHITFRGRVETTSSYSGRLAPVPDGLCQSMWQKQPAHWPCHRKRCQRLTWHKNRPLLRRSSQPLSWAGTQETIPRYSKMRHASVNLAHGMYQTSTINGLPTFILVTARRPSSNIWQLFIWPRFILAPLNVTKWLDSLRFSVFQPRSKQQLHCIVKTKDTKTQNKH